MAAPSYYRFTFSDGYEADVLDVLMAANLPPAVTLAVKHLFRYGRKAGEPAIADVGKAIDYLCRHRDVLISEAMAEEPEPVATRDVEIDEAGPIDQREYARALRRASRERG